MKMVAFIAEYMSEYYADYGEIEEVNGADWAYDLVIDQGYRILEYQGPNNRLKTFVYLPSEDSEMKNEE
jgi:hypothetical protein